MPGVLYQGTTITQPFGEFVVSSTMDVVSGEGRRIIEICAEINEDQPAVTLHDANDPVDVQLTLLEADAAIEKRLERYRDTISDSAFRNLTELCQRKLRAQVLMTVVRIQGK